MKIIRAGYNNYHSSKFKINRPLGSGDYLLLIIKTEAYIVLDAEQKISPQNSVVVFKKGTPQVYGACGDTYINDWIHFEITKEEEEVFAELGIPFNAILPLREIGELSGFIKSIFSELHSQNIHKSSAAQRYFDLLLLKISEAIHAQSPKHEHPLYNQFCKLRNEIKLKPQKDWSIDLICQKMLLSRSHVQHLYKSFFDTGIVADIQNGRIEYAKYLLSATDMTVSAVSHSCGYASDVHFMRIFKKTVGVSPSEFRKKN